MVIYYVDFEQNLLLLFMVLTFTNEKLPDHFLLRW